MELGLYPSQSGTEFVGLYHSQNGTGFVPQPEWHWVCTTVRMVLDLYISQYSTKFINQSEYYWQCFRYSPKKRTYIHIATNNFGHILISDGEYTDNFGRSGPILRT